MHFLQLGLGVQRLLTFICRCVLGQDRTGLEAAESELNRMLATCCLDQETRRRMRQTFDKICEHHAAIVSQVEHDKTNLDKVRKRV